MIGPGPNVRPIRFACPRSLLDKHLPGLESALPPEVTSQLLAFEPAWAALFRLLDILVLDLPQCLALMAVPNIPRLEDHIQVGEPSSLVYHVK